MTGDSKQILFSGSRNLILVGTCSHFCSAHPIPTSLPPTRAGTRMLDDLLPPPPGIHHIRLQNHPESRGHFVQVQWEASCKKNRSHSWLSTSKMATSATWKLVKNWSGCGQRWMPGLVGVWKIKVGSYSISISAYEKQASCTPLAKML